MVPARAEGTRASLHSAPDPHVWVGPSGQDGKQAVHRRGDSRVPPRSYYDLWSRSGHGACVVREPFTSWSRPRARLARSSSSGLRCGTFGGPGSPVWTSWVPWCVGIGVGVESHWGPDGNTDLCEPAHGSPLDTSTNTFLHFVTFGRVRLDSGKKVSPLNLPFFVTGLVSPF